MTKSLAEKFEKRFATTEVGKIDENTPYTLWDYNSDDHDGPTVGEVIFDWLTTAEAETRQDERERIAELVMRPPESVDEIIYNGVTWLNRSDLLSFLTSSK